MRIVPIVLLAAVTMLARLAVPPSAAAEDFVVLKASLKLAVKMTIPRPSEATDLVVTRKLKNKDIINLALGRPLSTKVDSKTEILAALGTFEDPSSSPLARLVVFDPSQNGVAQVTTTVIQPTVADFDKAYLSKTSAGVGTGAGVIQTTTLGNPAQNGFIATTVNGGGEGSGSHGLGMISPAVKFKGKGTMVGPIKFNVTEKGVTSTFDGYIVKGEGKISGKPIGVFSD